MLLDSAMQVMDGLEALRSILELDPTANIVMLCVPGGRSIMEEAIRLGAKGIVVKPFQADALIEAVKKVLQDPA